ncbi:hypothetical protein Hypma_009871 [Hypsizygus marmoreus]|uniref:Uncharacterized protein n=1 Tax=Hypsizygus marmoreus TaxID=39966 RepID=A0A369JLI5_HYPMA|nr:hypothetical protein Hypma_009871 [Hypsizygus marmoreus]
MKKALLPFLHQHRFSVLIWSILAHASSLRTIAVKFPAARFVDSRIAGSISSNDSSDSSRATVNICSIFECLSSGRTAKKLDAHLNTASTLGGFTQPSSPTTAALDCHTATSIASSFLPTLSPQPPEEPP